MLQLTPMADVAAAPPTVYDRDLATAGRLQRMLLPRSLFTSNGWTAAHHYEPAGVMSGDYLDLVPHGDRLYFMLGDVSGKGVVAALLMAQLHAMFRALIPFRLPLEDLMKRASALLCASSLPAQYATLVTGYLDDHGDVAIANAGHPPPLLIKSGAHSEIKATGFPVGLFCDSQFSTTTLTLERGDTVFLYTDGLTDAENHDEMPFGAVLERTLGRAVRGSVSDLLAAVVSDQFTFRAGASNADDMTLLAIRRGGATLD